MSDPEHPVERRPAKMVVFAVVVTVAMATLLGLVVVAVSAFLLVFLA